jgi:hypothetical protein
MGLEALTRYKEGLPFENFITTHIKNRLINFKRDNFERKIKNSCSCDKCKNCLKRAIKRNIIEPLSIENIDDRNESFVREAYEMTETFDVQEIQNIIDENLPAEYREDYLKMQAGMKIPYVIKKKIQNIISEILTE